MKRRGRGGAWALRLRHGDGSRRDAIVDHTLDHWGSHAGTTHRPALSI